MRYAETTRNVSLLCTLFKALHPCLLILRAYTKLSSREQRMGGIGQEESFPLFRRANVREDPRDVFLSSWLLFQPNLRVFRKRQLLV